MNTALKKFPVTGFSAAGKRRNSGIHPLSPGIAAPRIPDPAGRGDSRYRSCIAAILRRSSGKPGLPGPCIDHRHRRGKIQDQPPLQAPSFLLPHTGSRQASHTGLNPRNCGVRNR